jgi:2-hydroxy-3-keto-5-methylthiopentenyl-1-phosphate phosphatase
MKTKDRKYRALISTDWNQCLAPSGPFDFITFIYPSLDPEVKAVFKAYTGNHISLSEAIRRIAILLPKMITEEQMDTYLDERFVTYQGVPELIEWCNKNDVLFMVNTTGMQGYFQRAFKKKLLPRVSVVSAHPMIKFKEEGNMPGQWYDLLEIQDKPKNTQAVMRASNIPPEKVILIGDSGGDGPHFEWGARAGAYLIGSMTKESLSKYCRRSGIEINLQFGLSTLKRQITDPEKEMRVDFMDLPPFIAGMLDL